MDEISKRISSGIGALKRLRPFVSLDTAKKIYDSLIQPHFDYCCTVWGGINNQLTEKLQKLANRAARVITKSSYEVSSSPLLDALGWEKLISNRQKHKAIMVFKSLHNLTPVYLHNMFYNFNTHYGLRNSTNKLILPKPRTEYLKCSFSYTGAALWNTLPQALRECNSLGLSKRRRKLTFLL